MKKVLFIVALVAVSFAGTAQTSKSTWMLGGGAGFNSSKPDGASSTSTWNLSPSLGYFVMDNLALGASVSIADNGGGTKSNFGPFVRYYFTSLGKSAKLFGNVGANFGDYTEFGVKAGVAYFLNSSIALETALGYSKNTTAKVSNIGLM